MNDALGDVLVLEAGYEERLKETLKKAEIQQPELNKDRVLDAFRFASQAHRTQRREGGEPYIVHPLSVASTVMELTMDEDSIVSALLHDTVEDTGTSLTDIRRRYGGQVSRLVDSLTKVGRINLFSRFAGRTSDDKQATNLQKLFIAMAKDPRVIVIKLADRLDNLRTIEHLPEHKRIRIATESLEFYVPIARRLGLGRIYTEMEDLAFKTLNSTEYSRLEKKIQKSLAEQFPFLQVMMEKIRAELLKEGVKVINIYGRKKHLYSTYRKMMRKNVEIDQIFDLLAIRIIVENRLDCYRALGVIHNLYKPIFSRFRDFIAYPKSNGYQTLHTSVIGLQGKLTEIQIRTPKMHLEAEIGIASHYLYKEDYDNHTLSRDLSWLGFIREMDEEKMRPSEFVLDTKTALLEDEVLVLSPDGEVISLPRGSTPVDFAYYIHTELGHNLRGARVNSAQVSLDHILQNGDIVEIIKGQDGLGPQLEWLSIARSPKTILKIKRWFSRQSKQLRIQQGRNMLKFTIEKNGLYPLNLMSPDKLKALITKLKLRSTDDLFDLIGSGEIKVERLIQILREFSVEEVLASKQEDGVPTTVSAPGRELGIVLGDKRPLNMQVVLAPCCNPIPGDEIFGLLERPKRRLIIHRKDLIDGHHLGAGQKPVTLAWFDQVDAHFPSCLRILGLNRVGLLFDILSILNRLSVNFLNGKFTIAPSMGADEIHASFKLLIEVKSLDQLNALIAEIKGVIDVLSVERDSFDYEVQRPEPRDRGESQDTPLAHWPYE